MFTNIKLSCLQTGVLEVVAYYQQPTFSVTNFNLLVTIFYNLLHGFNRIRHLWFFCIFLSFSLFILLVHYFPSAGGNRVERTLREINLFKITDNEKNKQISTHGFAVYSYVLRQ